MTRLFSLLAALLTTVAATAQMADPVHFTSDLRTLANGEGEVVFTATIDDGWHVYSTDIGQDGPVEATFHADRLEGVELVGRLVPRGTPVSTYDPMFGMELKYFEHTATFVQRVRFTEPRFTIDCYLEYGACNEEMCLPPTQVLMQRSGEADVAPAASGTPTSQEQDRATPDALADTLAADAPVQTDTLAVPADAGGDALWAPVIDELQTLGQDGGTDEAADSSLWFIFLSGLLGGLLAILTPCVWPIIPMTVSFFLKRNKERRKAVREAVTYGLSIVVIYVVLGLLVTLLFGASALNALSTNALFNIFFALLLVVFAASFFGAFELTLPSSWSTKIDEKVDQLESRRKKGGSWLAPLTGNLAIFLMAFTLALVSFSCTGPIIGFLLVAVSTQGEIIGPTVGMLGFAIALAVPFTLFALFPSLLKQAPRSGGWMNTVKVVLGFIELAFALKFLSVADLAYGWHLLDRETFLALWIVLFALLGAYLLGWLKFAHDEPERRTNVPQFFLALLSMAFAVYMVPGLWGAPLKAISAFSPPMNTQDFSLYDGTVEARFTDYDLALAAARAEGKPVMVDFTGYGCVNCRKMEAAVWTDPQVQQLLREQYVLVSLYVDDKTPLPGGPVEVVENGQTRRLRTVGDRWSYLQRTKVGQNTQPTYLLLDPATGRPLGPLRSYNEDIAAYVDFLRQGLARYRAR